MAKNKSTKTEVSASVLESAKKVMQTLNIDKAHITEDGYIFPKACDARAYVGKDGSFTTVTDEEVTAKASGETPEGPQGDEQRPLIDPNIDEHKKE